VTSPSGQAKCTESYARASRHAIVASYGGDSNYLASSGSLTQVVAAISPVISRLRVTASHGKLRVSLVLSLAARLTITVYREVTGRIVHNACRLGAKHGRSCRTEIHRATLMMKVSRGRHTLRPRMRALAPGRYLVFVTGATAAGGRSRRYKAALVVRGG
jgi:hypothetical protein